MPITRKELALDTKIIRYLLRHQPASLSEIADGISVPVDEVDSEVTQRMHRCWDRCPVVCCRVAGVTGFKFKVGNQYYLGNCARLPEPIPVPDAKPPKKVAKRR